MTKYFFVTAMCGHVGGKGYYIPITFPVRANSAKAAAAVARSIPRVKHHHKDAIQHVHEVTREEYTALRQQNNSDPYLCCKSVQEQRIFEDIYDRIVEEKKEDMVLIKDGESDVHYYAGKKPIRRVKNFIKNYPNYARISKVRTRCFVA